MGSKRCSKFKFSFAKDVRHEQADLSDKKCTCNEFQELFWFSSHSAVSLGAKDVDSWNLPRPRQLLANGRLLLSNSLVFC